MSKQIVTGATALVKQLIAEGVDTLFGVPGIQIMSVFDALYHEREHIRLVHTRHEQGAAFMAYGYAKATGRPGVVLVVPGPGLLNATAALGTGYASNTPLLVLAGQIPRGVINRGHGHLHEVIDQLDCVRPLSKWVHRVLHATEIPSAIHEGVRQLSTGRPRPVVIDVPPDALTEQAEVEIVPFERYLPEGGDIDAIRRAATLLAGAERPAFVAGGGALASNAGAALHALAELLDGPILITQNAKGVLPESDARVAGVTYFAGIGPAYAALPQSDVILCVGSRFMIRGLKLRPEQRVIQIDIDPLELGRNFPVEIGITADAKTSLLQLLSEVQALVTSPRHSQHSDYRTSFAATVRELTPAPAMEAIESLRQALDPSAIVVSGMNTVGYWSHLAFPVEQPRSYITPGFFGTLGYELPTALGAKIAYPERQVVAICGDGGFMFSAEELATAVAYKINVVTVLFNNDAYGASEWDQRQFFGERYIGTKLHNPDFVKFTESFGAVAMRTDLAGLTSAVREALALERPVVIEVKFPNLIPPFNLNR